MTFRQLSIAFVLAAALASRAYAAPVVADVQIVKTADDAWVVRVRSSEAQAFDVVDDDARFVLRLHRATISASMAAIDAAPFGRVALSQHEEGVDVALSRTGFQVVAVQGASPDVVELRVTRSR